MLECNKKRAVLHCRTLQHTSRNSFLWIRLQHETLWISLRLPAVTCSIYCVYMLIYIRQGCSPLHCFLLMPFFTHTSTPAGSQQGEKGWVTDNHAWILYSKWGMNRLAWTITFIFWSGVFHFDFPLVSHTPSQINKKTQQGAYLSVNVQPMNFLPTYVANSSSQLLYIISHNLYILSSTKKRVPVSTQFYSHSVEQFLPFPFPAAFCGIL